jgi:hypothetical protein
MARITKADLELENNELRRKSDVQRIALHMLLSGEVPDGDELVVVNSALVKRLRLFRCSAPHGGVVIEEWSGIPNGFCVNFLDDRKEDGAGYTEVNAVIKKFKDIQIAKNLRQAV